MAIIDVAKRPMADALMVDREEKKLIHYRRPTLSNQLKRFRSYTIAIGALGYETPQGWYVIKRKAKDPDWWIPNSEWVDKDFRDSWADNNYVVPGGHPDNPIRVAFLEIDARRGIGIHGTTNRESLGTAASHGCIRLSEEDALRVYKSVPVKLFGCPVYII